jgi:hypothetical protein
VLHRTKLNFREARLSETGFPGMSLLGSWVKRGNGSPHLSVGASALKYVLQ